MTGLRRDCFGCSKPLIVPLGELLNHDRVVKVLIVDGRAEGYEYSETAEGREADYYCVKCWESTE